ncbi:spike base protein, RCAP_Rcc01079 family [Aquabacter cavernae]|uniref:spike base protein, RCAP_Rcc01079 family n=1 Tax=Aquabacter cavernae TaxID=2496029 RepID=UPI000F8C540D|nr:hypothetical protein [Aquabacter cavernae]
MPYDPARDPVHGLAASASSPARLLRRVVPSDTGDLAVYAKSLWVHVPATLAEATVRVTCAGAADGESVDVLAASGLQPLPPVQVRRVWATGTTAGLAIYALSDR